MRLARLAFPLLCLAGPAAAADLGPYVERETYYRPPPPPPAVVERHYYYPAPVYAAPRVYYAPPVYAAPVYPRRYAYSYYGWGPYSYLPRRFGHYGHHRYW